MVPVTSDDSVRLTGLLGMVDTLASAPRYPDHLHSEAQVPIIFVQASLQNGFLTG